MVAPSSIWSRLTCGCSERKLGNAPWRRPLPNLWASLTSTAPDTKEFVRKLDHLFHSFSDQVQFPIRVLYDLPSNLRFSRMTLRSLPTASRCASLRCNLFHSMLTLASSWSIRVIRPIRFNQGAPTSAPTLNTSDDGLQSVFG